MNPITGKTLIEWGIDPKGKGKWFGEALASARFYQRQGWPMEKIRTAIEIQQPKPVETIPLRFPGAYRHHLKFNIQPQNKEETDNVAAVAAVMGELMRLPTIDAAAVMPDACPAGVIPVGGIVAAKDAIHPGFHSADICCSVALANFGKVDPKKLLDRAQEITHFGPGGRHQRYQRTPSPQLVEKFRENTYLQWVLEPAHSHFATQGDGNHFLYVGTLKSTGDTVVVTHHGSRKPGAMLYKAGMRDAEFHTKKLCPEAPKGTAWLDAESDEGRAYWEALQLIGEWTRASHFELHSLISRFGSIWPIQDWFWNEHNFIFRRSDGYFYHAKGATPGWADYQRTLVPLNMAEPILITRGTDAKNGLGFLPHGAGRNMSRTRFLKENPEVALPAGIDARAYCGIHDLSELPSAYKNAAEVRRQIEVFGLAEVIDEVLPYGNIMGGDFQTYYRNLKEKG